MPDRTLLPNEPGVLHWDVEQDLTERHLWPVRRELEVFFLALRESLDARLRAAQPFKLGKPYPLGQCLEITQAVQACLQQPAAPLHGAAADGFAALSAFVLAGGTARQVWGDLRGEYFQNAFLLGTLYVDVSNDTVVASKPKVEILPWAQARFSAVRDYRHYALLVNGYWKAHVFPNHVLPTLAPYFPWFVALPDGSIRLEADSHYMFALNLASEYRASEAVLQDPPMEPTLFQALAQALGGTSLALASDPLAGRSQALVHCAQCRAERPVLSAQQRQDVIEGLRVVNGCLARFRVAGLSCN